MGGASAVVVVDGWGSLAGEAAAAARRVGAVVRSGAHAATAAELELDDGGPAPALVVVATDDAGSPALRAAHLAPWQVRGVPLLPMRVANGGVVIGPLLVPGRSACVACALPTSRPGPVPVAPVTREMAVLAGAVAAVTAAAVLRGDLRLRGISTEIGREGPTVTHRLWTSRPGCGCASARMAG